MGFAENEIILDALSCYPRSVKTEPTVSNNALNNFLENRAVHKFYNGTRDILGELLAYPNVNYRYYVLNNDPALGLDEINFNADATWHLQLNGIAQAADAIAAGPGFGVQTLQNWDANVDGVQSKFASFGHYFED